MCSLLLSPSLSLCLSLSLSVSLSLPLSIYLSQHGGLCVFLSEIDLQVPLAGLVVRCRPDQQEISKEKRDRWRQTRIETAGIRSWPARATERERGKREKERAREKSGAGKESIIGD